MVEQLTIFLQNEKGRLAACCKALADAGINMHSLNVADTADFGVARVICDTPKAAAKALDAAGFRANATPVLAVEVPNVPGGLAKLLAFLDSKDVNLEYAYCFSVNNEKAVDVLRIDGAESIEDDLMAAGFAPVDASEIYKVD